MATLALAAAGAAAGSALLPTGISVLGMTVTGAAIGTQIGAMAGSYIDNALFSSSGKSRVLEGPRLTDLVVTSSTEGVAIPRLYGRARIGGQVIWAKDIREEVVTQKSSGGSGKGLGGSSQPANASIEYRYYATFAVALCEGEITGLGRVWADGAELDLASYTHRLYHGSEEQMPDAAISAHEGASRAIAYRGLAYVVFDDMPLKAFGNRIPQLAFEVHRSIDDFCNRVPGVVITPGSGEFVYATETVSKIIQPGVSTAENLHTRQGGCDWSVSIDQLEETHPNAKSASLVVSWFGTDLRAGQCKLKPGIDLSEKTTEPQSWQVAGQSRASAYLVSTKDGRPAYGARHLIKQSFRRSRI